jgi:hypothetical protein
LDTWREDVEAGKEAKSEFLPNQYIQTHTKDDLTSMNRPSKSHSKTIDTYVSNVRESIDRINDLIKKVI